MPADAVALIRELAPQARIVVYSGHGDFETVTYMLDLGVDGYILKVDDLPAVVRAIRDIAAGERRFSPELTPILAERGVLQMLADGMSTRQIALEMHVVERTVRDYVSKAAKKLKAKSRIHAITMAMRKR